MDNIIEATILTGKFKGEDVLLPRPIPIILTDLPFEFKRLQFSLRLASAIAINKAQEQSQEVCGFNLENPFISHLHGNPLTKYLTKTNDGEENSVGEVIAKKSYCDKKSDSEDQQSDNGDSETEVKEKHAKDNDDEDEDDALSDLKYSDSESEIPKSLHTKLKTKNIKETSKASKVNSKLPFAIEMPSNYGELRELLINHSPEDQGTLVERIIKCNHSKLEPKNKEKANIFFAYLLQYINDIFADASTEDIARSFGILDKINPFLYDLSHLNPEKASLCLLDIIQEKYLEFKRNNKSFPPLETLVFFKIISNLYTTSDYRHDVVTPCFVFISHILSKARVRTRQNVAMGLFLVTLVLEYSHSSHRFVPSALNFLLGVIYLSLPKRQIETMKIVPPFMSTGPLNRLLVIAEKSNAKFTAEYNLLKGEDLVMTTFSVDFKIRALNSALRLTKEAIDGISENVGSNFFADPFLPIIEKIDLDVYPTFIKSSYEEVKSSLLSVTEKPLKKLVPPERKLKALRLFEPRIEKVYDDKRRPKISKSKEEKVKLIHKIRRETKGAVREIRRDTEFLQKMRITQQIQSDRDRKEKVKRIYMEASIQQGELNELSRKKKN